jgi:hypothetical protein
VGNNERTSSTPDQAPCRCVAGHAVAQRTNDAVAPHLVWACRECSSRLVPLCAPLPPSPSEKPPPILVRLSAAPGRPLASWRRPSCLRTHRRAHTTRQASPRCVVDPRPGSPRSVAPPDPQFGGFLAETSWRRFICCRRLWSERFNLLSVSCPSQQWRLWWYKPLFLRQRPLLQTVFWMGGAVTVLLRVKRE